MVFHAKGRGGLFRLLLGGGNRMDCVGQMIIHLWRYHIQNGKHVERLFRQHRFERAFGHADLTRGIRFHRELWAA